MGKTDGKIGIFSKFPSFWGSYGGNISNLLSRLENKKLKRKFKWRKKYLSIVETKVQGPFHVETTWQFSRWFMNYFENTNLVFYLTEKKKKIEILGYFFLPRIAANEQRDLLDITDNLRGQNRKRKLKTDFGDFKKGQVIINKRRWCCETSELNSSGSVTDINLWNYIGINFRANNNIALKKSFDD